jgi:hypothetical protein
LGKVNTNGQTDKMTNQAFDEMLREAFCHNKFVVPLTQDRVATTYPLSSSGSSPGLMEEPKLTKEEDKKYEQIVKWVEKAINKKYSTGIREQHKQQINENWKRCKSKIETQLNKKTVAVLCREYKHLRLVGMPRSPKAAVVAFLLDDIYRSYKISANAKMWHAFHNAEIKAFNEMTQEEGIKYLEPVRKEFEIETQ